MKWALSLGLALLSIAAPAAADLILSTPSSDDPVLMQPLGMLSNTIGSDKFLTNLSIVENDSNNDGFLEGNAGVMVNPCGYVLMHPLQSKLNVRVTLGHLMDVGSNPPMEAPSAVGGGSSDQPSQAHNGGQTVVPEPVTATCLILGSLVLLRRKKPAH
jgi:hypothetical protein